MPVEDNWRRLRWRLPTPTPNVLQDGADGLVHRPKIDSVALAVNRYKTPRSRRSTLKPTERIPDNSQIQHLLLFHAIGPNHDRRLIRDGVAALTNDPQSIAIAATFATSRLASVRTSMPEDMARSLYEQIDVLVRWSLARYDAL